MDLKECMTALGGSYDEIMGRLMTEDRVKKFLAMFPADPSYDQLLNAMDNGDYESAFRAAHTLKGLCANLSIDNLGASAAEITEALRGNVNNGADALLPAVMHDYELAIQAIALLD